MKTEAELIATVPNIPDAASCLRFAERARKSGMNALALACEERASLLKPPKAPRASKSAAAGINRGKGPLKTHRIAEQALEFLIQDYFAGLAPTTYGDLARRCGFGETNKLRWFGQVTDLIDAASALSGLPSFALVRVRDANGEINNEAWQKEYSHLREHIVSKALAARWNPDDFQKIQDALALFTANGFGNKKAWQYVIAQIDLEAWAGAAN